MLAGPRITMAALLSSLAPRNRGRRSYLDLEEQSGPPGVTDVKGQRNLGVGGSGSELV